MAGSGGGAKFWAVGELSKNLLVGKCSSKNAKFGAEAPINENLGATLKVLGPVIFSVENLQPSVGKLQLPASPSF